MSTLGGCPFSEVAYEAMPIDNDRGDVFTANCMHAEIVDEH